MMSLHRPQLLHKLKFSSLDVHEERKLFDEVCVEWNDYSDLDICTKCLVPSADNLNHNRLSKTFLKGNEKPVKIKILDGIEHLILPSNVQ